MEKEEKVSEKGVPSVTERFFVITSSCSPWRCQANLWPHLWRNPRCSKSLLGERYPWCCDIHRARQEKDCDSHGCSLRSQTPGTYSVRIWRLDVLATQQSNGSFRSHQICKSLWPTKSDPYACLLHSFFTFFYYPCLDLFLNSNFLEAFSRERLKKCRKPHRNET